MKPIKYLLSLAAIVLMAASCKPMDKPLGVEPEKVDWTRDFYHRSLVMRFTANWCGWCPQMGEGIKKAQDNNPDKIMLLDIHVSSDPMAFTDAKVLMEQYNVGGYPTAYFDSRYKVQNGGVNDVSVQISGFLAQVEQKPAGSAVSYKSSFSGNNLKLNLFLYLRTAADYKVSVFLIEDGIVAKQSDYVNEDSDSYVHNDVARVSVTNPLGDSFTTTTENSIKSFDYSVDVPAEYVKDNLKILVSVQKRFEDEYYVDNCVVGKAGKDLSIQY